MTYLVNVEVGVDPAGEKLKGFDILLIAIVGSIDDWSAISVDLC